MEKLPHYSAPEKEKEFVEKFRDFFRPQNDYREGARKLNFSCEFSTGEVFRATEDENGTAKIVLEREGKTIINFDQLLPPDFKFVTPTYLHRERLGRYAGEWRGSIEGRRLVSIGDMNRRESILALLHEIGHTSQHEENREILQNLQKGRRLETSSARAESSFLQNYFKAYSLSERRAWARAIKIIRSIRKEFGVDLLEGIDRQGLRIIVYGALMAHRYYIEEMLGEEKRILVADYLPTNEAETEKLVRQLLEDLEKLFDKRRLRRGRVEMSGDDVK